MMTNEEIKKGLVLCQDGRVSVCRDCPYTENCDGTQLYKDALNLITEQEKENERLKEQIEELRNEKWDAQDDLDCYYDEMPSKIKQAKIDVLNELWEKVKDNGVDYKIGMRALSEEIDELIKEIEK